VPCRLLVGGLESYRIRLFSFSGEHYQLLPLDLHANASLPRCYRPHSWFMLEPRHNRWRIFLAECRVWLEREGLLKTRKLSSCIFHPASSNIASISENRIAAYITINPDRAPSAEDETKGALPFSPQAKAPPCE